MIDHRFEYALVGYHLWLESIDVEPVETIPMPPGWIESASPFVPGFAGLTVCDEGLLFTALPPGLAADFARGFDKPDEHLFWYLRQRLVPS